MRPWAAAGLVLGASIAMGVGCTSGDATGADRGGMQPGPEVSVEGAPVTFDEVAATVEGPDGLIELCLLLARSGEQRSRGLMDAPDEALWGYDGMAFSFEDESIHGFWMKDTEVPLSIAWVSSAGSVVDVADMDPCPPGTPSCPITTPGAASVLAVEVPQGRLAERGLVEGATVDVGGACPA